MDRHDIRHGYLRVDEGLKGLEITVVVTDYEWEPSREFLIDTAEDVRDMYPGMDVVIVKWTREDDPDYNHVR